MADVENPQPQAQGKVDITHLENASVNQIKWMVRISNLIAAGMIIGCGVNNFIPVPDFAGIIIGAYVILLGCLVCCFELHLRRFDQYVFENFGFMYHWGGRFLFLFFVGTLSFGLGAFGLAAGIVSIVNVLFNLYVMKIHGGYRAYMTAANAQYKANARHAAQQELQAKANFSFQDAKNAAKFYKDNKQQVDQAAQFYSENKEAVDNAAKFAASHGSEINQAAQAGKNAGFI